MIRVPVGDQFALIDDDDGPSVLARKWTLHSNGYAISNLTYLHHFIVGRVVDMEVDHMNGDRLDNRRSNLRIVTRSINRHNSKRRRDACSPYRGVHLSTRLGRWIPKITVDGRVYQRGSYPTPEEANQVRLQMERELVGIQPQRKEAHA